MNITDSTQPCIAILKNKTITINVLEFKGLSILQHPNMLYAVQKGNASLVLDAKCLNNMPTLKECYSPQYF